MVRRLLEAGPPLNRLWAGADAPCTGAPAPVGPASQRALQLKLRGLLFALLPRVDQDAFTLCGAIVAPASTAAKPALGAAILGRPARAVNPNRVGRRPGGLRARGDLLRRRRT